MQRYRARPRLHHVPPPPPAAVAPNSIKKEEDEATQSQGASIEDLHESILYRIISFLPTDSAVQTSGVAPAWRNLWRFVPVLDFDMFCFHCRIPRASIRRARKLFAIFTCTVLHKRPVGIALRKFKLHICYKDSPLICLMVDYCLQFAIDSGVVELDCDFEHENTYVHPGINFPYDEDLYESDDESDEDDDEDEDDYSFDFSMLEDHKVAVLRLRDCTFSMPEVSVQFESVKELYLENFPCSEKKIMSMISSCPNLEALSLIGGNNMENLKIVSSKLKIFRLDDYRLFDMGDGSVDIHAPCLETIELSSVFVDKFTLSSTPALSAAAIGYGHMCYMEFVFWTYLIFALSGVECLITQNMWHWAVQGLEDEDAPKNLLGAKTWPKRGTYVSRGVFFKEELYSIKVQPEKQIFSEMFEFQNLKHVELLTGYRRDDIIGLEILLSTCPILETMALVYAYTSKLDNDVRGKIGVPIVLMMPCLKFVKMKEFRNTKSELFVVDLLKKHGVVLEEIVAYPKKANEIPMPPFVL